MRRHRSFPPTRRGGRRTGAPSTLDTMTPDPSASSPPTASVPDRHHVRGPGADRLPRTLAALEAGRREGLHLGAQLYVSHRFRPVADLALGEVRPGEPLTPDHLVLWLSASKPLTAVAVLQLWEQGLCDLDDPVARHLPAFARGGKEGVTVRHLLTHTGGLRMPPARIGWPGADWDEIVATVCARKREPGWVPGEKAGYHQMGSWFVLGELVRRLDGRPVDRYLRQEILEPLGMEDGWVGMPVERYREYVEQDRFAPPWDTSAGDDGRRRGDRSRRNGEGAGEEQRLRYDDGVRRDHRRQAKRLDWQTAVRVVPPSPAGNGHGPMRALGRFYEALLGGGRPPGGGAASRILSPQAVEAATARHRAGMFDHTFQHVLDWGLGFIVDSKQYGADTVPYAYGRLCSRRTYGHSGYRSTTAFADPVHGLVVALGCNGLPEAAAHERRTRTVLDALYVDLGLAPEPASDNPQEPLGTPSRTPANMEDDP